MDRLPKTPLIFWFLFAILLPLSHGAFAIENCADLENIKPNLVTTKGLSNGVVSRLLSDAFMPLADGLLQRTKAFDLPAAAAALKGYKIKLNTYNRGVPQFNLPEGEYEPNEHFWHRLTQNLWALDGEIEGRSMQEFVWTEPAGGTAKVEAPLEFSLMRTPVSVGAYGREFAAKLALTTQILHDLVRTDLNDVAERVWADNENLLRMETARGEGQGSALLTFVEGIQSLTFTLSTTTANGIAGSKTGAEALNRIFFQGENGKGLVSEFAASVPLGIIGPMGLSGRTFEEPFAENSEGRLSLAKRLKGFFREWRENIFPTHVGPGKRGVCPFALLFSKGSQRAEVEKTGLQKVVEAYWRVFKLVDQANSQERMGIDLSPLHNNPNRIDYNKFQ